jgi:WbqC-like protein
VTIGGDFKFMKCVINQPNYIPWRGYFHQIRKADVFVFYDDVQYDKHGWRNRNRIKTGNGPIWLTIPVIKKGAVKNHTPINEIFIDWTRNWSSKHWKTIEQAYGKAPFFEAYASTLKQIYEQRYDKLADLTIQVTILIAGVLGISGTKFVRSSSLNAIGTKTSRLLDLLGQVGATHYITGPAAKSYLDEEKLGEAGISTEYMVYDYPVYSQLYPPYDPHVSVLDLLFMKGPDSPKYIWEGFKSDGETLGTSPTN